MEACGREVKTVNLESVSLGCVVSLDEKLGSTLSFFTQVCEWVSSDVLSGDGLVLHATLRKTEKRFVRTGLAVLCAFKPWRSANF